MAYDEYMAKKIRRVLSGREDVTERKMFGGLAFLIRGNICCGISGNTLMARIGEEQYEEAMQNEYAKDVNFTNKAVHGFVYTSHESLAGDGQLEYWVRLSEKFTSTIKPKTSHTGKAEKDKKN